jgi:hypothetical protein
VKTLVVFDLRGTLAESRLPRFWSMCAIAPTSAHRQINLPQHALSIGSLLCHAETNLPRPPPLPERDRAQTSHSQSICEIFAMNNPRATYRASNPIIHSRPTTSTSRSVRASIIIAMPG